jgi:hypothetical protein
MSLLIDRRAFGLELQNLACRCGFKLFAITSANIETPIRASGKALSERESGSLPDFIYRADFRIYSSTPRSLPAGCNIWLESSHSTWRWTS